MDTQMVDQEPRRSVQLIRRIDTRIPKPLLSAAAAANNLGKLADLRASPNVSPLPRTGVSPAAAPVAPSPVRGWTSVVSASQAQGQGHSSRPVGAYSSLVASNSSRTPPVVSPWNIGLTAPIPRVVQPTSFTSDLPSLRNAAQPTPPPPHEDVPDSWDDDV